MVGSLVLHHIINLFIYVFYAFFDYVYLFGLDDSEMFNFMYISGETIDDILFKLYPKIIKSQNVVESTKGRNRELTGVLLKLKNPRARLCRAEIRKILYSSLGETLWYFSGRNDLAFIKYYIPRYRETSGLPENAVTVRGAYGPKLFGSGGQVKKVITILKEKKSSRQAVIQIFDKSDLTKIIKELRSEKKDIGKKIVDVPCTCTIQFLCRNNRLNMVVSMRSNDAYIGLPHDIFAFTFLQEYVATCLAMKLGEYYHFVGSLHIYENKIKEAKKYIDLGVQRKTAMPPMPNGDPRKPMKWLLETEKKIRLGETFLPKNSHVTPYWQDIALILLIKKLQDKEDTEASNLAKKSLSTEFYDEYIREKMK
ncbi:thymidylate synthase [Bartonella sp. M0177]|uniref:thymidylate synthase n=1 Tax=Bartonella sp. M0177 TaxID=2750940 RepID=UPI0018DD1234|nr:thymidylate synthase [Bartonella sp. M0177]MBI0003610.1 thymidylate synthase [Bartonella sp. M0177]